LFNVFSKFIFEPLAVILLLPPFGRDDEILCASLELWKRAADAEELTWLLFITGLGSCYY
jgi:hypothetical protein